MLTDVAQALDTPETGEETLTLRVRLAGGPERAVPSIEGLSVMEALRANGVPIVAECGGAAVCATCHVRIASAWLDLLPAPSDEEQAKLDDIPNADDTSRLACQIAITAALDGLAFEVAADSLKGARA